MITVRGAIGHLARPASKWAICFADVLFFYCILVISFRPIISTFTGPMFTKSAGMVELWP